MKEMWKKIKRLSLRAQTQLNQEKDKRKYGVNFIPHFLTIEITNKCNANCTFCNRHYIKEICEMPLEHYKEIIQNIPFIETICPQGIGESLLHPNFIEMLTMAKEAGKKVMFYTNASLLDEEISKDILKTGVDEVRFSIDAMDKEQYEKIRRGLNWETVLRNVERFQTFKEANDDWDTTTVVRMCITEDTKDKVDEMLDFWKERVDIVSAFGELYIPPPQDIENNRLCSGVAQKCDMVNISMTIKCNGDMVICCDDWFCEYPIGNIFEENSISDRNLLDMFNGEAYNKYRTAIQTGNKYPLFCHSCSHKVKRLGYVEN